MQKLSFLSFDQLTPMYDKTEINKIIEFLNIKHLIYLDQETFEIENGFNKEQIQIKVCLKKNDNSVIYPIEIICLYENYPNFKRQEIFHIVLDFIDSYWSGYFMEERSLYLPIDWSSYESQGLQFLARGFVRHLNLEMQANALLKEHGHGEHDIFPISSEI